MQDADIVKEVETKPEDHVVIKCRDPAFHDPKIKVKLSSLGLDTLFFLGIDTTICVETSLRDVFILGSDVVLLANATISSNKKHYEPTIDNIKDYYGLVTDYL